MRLVPTGGGMERRGVQPQQRQVPHRSVAQNLPALDSAAISNKMKIAELKFTIDEKGNVIDVHLSKSSNDAAIDKLILEAANKMPAWTPAMNYKGDKVKREFTLAVDRRQGRGC